MKKEFRIVALRAVPFDEGVLLTVIPVFSAQSESRSLSPERVIVGPGVQSEDAKLMQEMMKGVLNELERRFGKDLSQVGNLPNLTLALTKEEYEELGQPLVHQIVTITLEKGNDELEV